LNSHSAQRVHTFIPLDEGAGGVLSGGLRLHRRAAFRETPQSLDWAGPGRDGPAIVSGQLAGKPRSRQYR
jgi:hypothetical protein